MKSINLLIILFLVSTSIAFGQVTVTPASGGTELVRSTARDGHLNVYTTLGDIVIAETLDDDFKQSQTNATLILTAPNNWEFDVGVGSVSTLAGDDITAISLNVAATTITVTFTVANGNQGMDSFDTVAISGIGVQAITYAITDSVNILRTTANSGDGTITGITNDVTNFGWLSLDPLSPMPVELTSFTADVEKNKVVLNWETATEVNNYGFQVQRRSISAQNSEEAWVNIGFVDGHGNTNSPKYYSFVDKDFSSGILKYRLKQLDTDGKFEIHPEIIVKIAAAEKSAKFVLKSNYPNPFNPSTRIQFDLKEQANVVLAVYNLLGEEISVLVDEYLGTGIHDVEFNANNLASGIYYYQLRVHTPASGTQYSKFKKMMLLK